MDRLVGQLVQGGLRHRTHTTYSSAQKLYFRFCADHQLQPVPASEQQILRFIVYAHQKSLAPSTIQVYLSGVSSLHTLNGWEAPPHISVPGEAGYESTATHGTHT